MERAETKLVSTSIVLLFYGCYTLLLGTLLYMIYLPVWYFVLFRKTFLKFGLKRTKRDYILEGVCLR